MSLPVPAWLPNAISFFRVLLVPVWVLCAECANRTAEAGDDAGDMRRLAAAVLVVIGASDVADGWLARSFGLQSHLGAALDAIADKLTQVVTITYLALRTGPAFAAVPLWFLGLLLGRDLLLLAGTLAIRGRRGCVDVEHRVHGKVSSLILFLLLLVFSADAMPELRQVLLVLAAVMLTVSTALYVRAGFRQYRRA
jgi:cardiolipin synthase